MDRCKKFTKAQPLLQGGTPPQGHTHARAPVQNSLDIKSKNEPQGIPLLASQVAGWVPGGGGEAGAGGWSGLWQLLGL